jgi:hypothetical protein
MNPQTGTKTKPLNHIATLTAIEADSTTGDLPGRIHLLRIGTFDTEKYGELTVTADDMREYVDHYNQGFGRPGNGKLGVPVNLRHDKGGVAAAWINGLEFDGTNLWGTPLDYTGTGKKVLADGDYKCLSSEFTPRCLGGMWVNPENTSQRARNVFTGAALTNIPMFTGNEPVMASAESTDAADADKQVIYINAKQKEQSMHNLEALRVKASADLTAEERTFVEAHAAELSADEKAKFDIKVEASTATTTKPVVVDASQVTGNEGLVTVDASALKTINDRLAAVEADNQAKKHDVAVASVDAAIADGKIVADQKDKWVKMIEADASNKELLEGLAGNGRMGTEQGKTGADANASTSAAAELKTAIEAAQKEDTKLSYTQAQTKVLADNSELAQRVQTERAEHAGSVN